jgi:L-cysteate sulfo-lyase
LLLEKKQNFAFLPTPLHKLNNLSKLLDGPDIFIKRDDMTGLAMGGNKTRKLEYIIKDAIDKQSDTIITIGAPQSNHCRQTAAACCLYNLECYLILVGNKNELKNCGNILLDKMFNSKILIFDTKEEADAEIENLMNSLKSENKNPYFIPAGGSFSPGVNGYISAFKEI